MGYGLLPSDLRDLTPGLVSGFTDFAGRYPSMNTVMPPWESRVTWGTEFLDGAAHTAAFPARAAACKGIYCLGSHIDTAGKRTYLKAAIDACVAAGLVGRTFTQLIRGQYGAAL
jgi:hypothetical protein